ncbi:MAG: ParA family protein [Actinomycetota bacterium]
MTKTVAVINSKGGVGKTTVTLGLASAAQAAGDTALVIDLDPSANATWGLRPGEIEDGRTTADVFSDGRRGSLADAVHPSGWGLEVDVVPSDPTLAQREADHVNVDHIARFRSAMEGVVDDYDLVFIDCAPSLGRISSAALAIADMVLLVTEPSALSVRGIAGVERRLDELNEELGIDIVVGGVVLNKVPARGSEAFRQVDELRGLVGKRAIWEPHLPNRVVLSEALADGTPIHWWGYKAAEVAGLFDSLYAKLQRTLARG